MRGFSVRSVFAVISVMCAFAAGAQNPSADELLQRGRDHFRAARYAEAAADLGAATQSYLSSEEMQAYVRTGRFDKLPQFETALIYLALAHAKLGHEAEAREAVLRLATAERIAPTYVSLPLEADAAEFESLASRLVPDLTLGANVQLARGGLTPPPSPRPLPTPAPQPVVVASSDADRVRLVEQMVAQECARIQREADQKITAARRESDERIAAERAAAKREADERVAAAERAAAERIAQIQKTANERVAAAEASARSAIAARTETERPTERVVVPAPVVVQPPVAVVPAPQPSRTPAPRPAPVPTPARETLAEGEWATALRRAGEFAAAGRFAEANEIYLRVAHAGVSRAARAQAAIGLYRTAAYRPAADVFAALAPFARGEEDLRFYNAVSLFEIGRYAEAQHELSCALPFIEQTDDVIRYRSRIEQMTAWQNALPARVEIQ